MAAQPITQNTEPTSGSVQDGPIWGYHFVPNQPVSSITSEAAIEFLTAPGPGLANEFLWLHFSLSNTGSEPWLRRYLTLPDSFYESLHSDVDATRLEQDADSLVARIHDNTRDTDFEPFAEDGVDGRDRSSWAQLEVHIFQELLARDARYLPQASRWARVLAQVKQMALGGEDPAAITRRLREARAELWG